MIAEKLRDMHALAADSCDPEYNRALLEAADEIDRLSELVREDPASWSFDTMLFIGRKMLAEVYPTDIFTGESGDSGPEFIVALRKAIARIDEKRGNGKTTKGQKP